MTDMKVVFLDRDGVINQKPAPHTYVIKWSEFVLLAGVGEAIKTLNDMGYKVIVVSNQRGVARGLLTLDDITAIHERLNQELGNSMAHIDDFFICPHGENECTCRKPDIGLFMQASEKYSIDRFASWMVGDSDSDIIAGNRFGLKTIRIGKNNLPNCEKSKPDFSCNSLLEAAKLIYKEEVK